MRGAHHASAGLPAKLTADLTARLNPFQRKVTEADVASTCQYNDLVEPRRGYHFQDNIPMSWHGCQWFSETSSSGLACKGQRLIESQRFLPMENRRNKAVAAYQNPFFTGKRSSKDGPRLPLWNLCPRNVMSVRRYVPDPGNGLGGDIKHITAPQRPSYAVIFTR